MKSMTFENTRITLRQQYVILEVMGEKVFLDAPGTVVGQKIVEDFINQLQLYAVEYMKLNVDGQYWCPICDEACSSQTEAVMCMDSHDPSITCPVCYKLNCVDHNDLTLKEKGR